MSLRNPSPLKDAEFAYSSGVDQKMAPRGKWQRLGRREFDGTENMVTSHIYWFLQSKSWLSDAETPCFVAINTLE
jgi:hypothetical protein